MQLHPEIARTLAADRIRDLHREAAATRLARTVRDVTDDQVAGVSSRRIRIRYAQLRLVGTRLLTAVRP